MSVRDILKEKDITSIYSVAPDATVYDAIAEMSSRNVGAMLVMQDGKLAGILTERDYLREVILKGRSSRETPVTDIMSRTVIYIEPDCSVDEALNIMTEKRIRHLPVLDQGTVVGVVSIGDLVKAKIVKHELHIRTLEAYIADQYPGPGTA
ncbi:CBS domain-containing protein [bacterium]|nr:CBS domain-containing protein [bacterium]